MPTIHDWPPSDTPGWTVHLDDQTGRGHVMPIFGPPHAFTPCWCHPVVPFDDYQMVLHQVPQ